MNLWILIIYLIIIIIINIFFFVLASAHAPCKAASFVYDRSRAWRPVRVLACLPFPGCFNLRHLQLQQRHVYAPVPLSKSILL